MNFYFSKIILLLLFLFLSNLGFAQNKKTVQDSTWHPTKNSTKLIYWPTAFGLKKGEHYYQNLYLIWQQFHFGITDNFSLGISMEVATLLLGESTPIFSLSPKYTEPLPIIDNLYVGVGAWTVFAYDLEDLEGIGVIYGLVSYGTENDNITLGLGHGNYDGRWSGIPQVNFGFNKRLGKRAGISSESWFFENGTNEAFSFFTMSFKYIGKNLSIDLGFVKGIGDSLIPLAGLTVPFGKSSK